MTGEQKYADLAKQCLDKLFAGQRDVDTRYSWLLPGGELRMGPVLGWVGAAYDLCYDAWPDSYRREVALRIQDYDAEGSDDDAAPSATGSSTAGTTNAKMRVAIKYMITQPIHGPASNHFGAVIGGCGLAILAIKGDPGTDEKLLNRYDEISQRQLVRNLNTNGFGDGGFFNEGFGPGQISSDTSYVPYLQALKTAQGRDYINGPRQNAAWITMVRVFEIIGPPAVYPHRSAMAGSYGTAEFHRFRSGLSRGGQVLQGFGAIPDAWKPALLWTYENQIEADPAKRNFDLVSTYPHRPMLALINWPFGQKAVNPAEIIGLTHRDTTFQYYLFRNRFQDAQDTVVTTGFNMSDGIRPRETMIWGFGVRHDDFPGLPKGAKPSQWSVARDGSGMIAAGGQALCVDYGKSSGAPVLVVQVASSSGRGKSTKGKPAGKGADPKLKLNSVTAGAYTYEIATLSPDGKHPDAKADGDALLIGDQRISFDGTNATMKAFTPK